MSFDNEYRYFYESGTARNPGFHETFLERTSETGLRYNFATIGPAILWAPFYAVADLAVRIAGGGMGPPDGLSHTYIAAVAYGSAFYGFLAVVLSMVAAARVVYGSAERIPPTAVAAALAIWFGTPLCFYMYVAPPMSHASSAFAVSAFVLAWLVVRQRWSLAGLAVLGALAGLMAMVREQDLFFIIGPSLDFVAHTIHMPPTRMDDDGKRGGAARARGGRRVRRDIPAAGPGVCRIERACRPLECRRAENGMDRALRVVRPSVACTRVPDMDATGLVGPVGPHVLARAESRRAERQIGAAGVVSAGHGRLSNLRDGQRRFMDARRRVRAAPVRRPHAHPGHWPHRTLSGDATGCNALGGSGRAVMLGVWWNVGLMLQFGSGLMDRQRLEPAQIAYNNFVVIPRQLPALAYRYVFARESFYRSPASDR